MILRPRQQAFVDRIDTVIAAGGRRIIGQAPTGFGKTVVAAHFAAHCAEQRKRMMFVVPALSLIDQTVSRFHQNGVWDVGVIQANHPLTNFARPIQVASIQTLHRRKCPPADLVLIDEVHKWHKHYGEWLADPAWEDVPFIGLTATPWAKGLGKYFDELIVAATVQDLIDEGSLSPFRVFAPSSPDLSKVRTVAGDYHEGDLATAMGGELVADIVKTWIDKGQSRPTLCFAVDRAHAKHLQREFLQHSIPTEYIDAFTDADEREAIRRRFHSGETKVVCNIGCLTTGVDWDVRCIILARPTKSEMLFVQMIGRGLRTADGKDHCLILDHSDNHSRLGFVTDIHHDELDSGKKVIAAPAEKKTALPKKCTKCSFMKPPKTARCPCCGFLPERQTEVKPAEGFLVEFLKRNDPVITDIVDGQKHFFRELKYYSKQRNFKPGWAAVNFKEKFGMWPPRDWDRLPPAETTKATVGWIKSKQIAYRKAQEAAHA